MMDLSKIMDKIEVLVHNWLDEVYSPVEIIEDNYYGIDKKLVFDKNYEKIIVIVLDTKGKLFKASIEDGVVSLLKDLFKLSEYEVKKFVTSWVLQKVENQKK